jgi:hypothetical protein
MRTTAYDIKKINVQHISSVGIVTKLQADDRGSVPVRGRSFCLLHSVQTASVTFSVQRYQADHSPQSTTKAKNGWSYTFTPPYVKE